ncbi:MAG: fasciclin domain-containing protein, partial [Dysgonamonadaceae bacterium]|nr:fasciclin domain-containing protein [Dysgonamonadaceae bacterium]
AFRYVPERDAVFADVYAVNPDGTKGALMSTYDDQGANPAIILNRLKDILDSHIVVGYKDKETGDMTGYIDGGTTQYALTKGGSALKVTDGGDRMKLSGGGDIEEQSPPAGIMTNPGNGTLNRYEADNGRTWFVDKVLHTPVQSVYSVLSSPVHADYAAFFELCQGDTRVFEFFRDDKEVNSNIIFTSKKVGSSSGLGMVVNSFNNFRYTVFVPEKAALDAAFLEDDKLFTWDEIAADDDYDSKKAKTLYLLKFLKYHFMDNSIFIDGRIYAGEKAEKYETAARNPSGKFHKLTLSSSGNNLLIEGEKAGNTAEVITTGSLYNLTARDYIVNSADYTAAKQIVASSHAVIHLINKALKFE